MSKISLKCDSLMAYILPLLLIALHYTGHIEFLIIVLFLGTMMVKRVETLFPAYWMASLSSMYFDLGEGISASRFMSLLIIISLLINFFDKKQKVNVQSAILFVLVIIYSLLSSVLGFAHSFSGFVVMLLNLLVFYLLAHVSNIDCEKILKYLTVVSLLLLAYSSYNAFVDGAFLFATRYLEGDTGGINANNMSMLVAQCGAIQIASFFCATRLINKMVSLIGVIFSILLIIALGSRASLIGIIVAILFSIYYSSTQIKKKYFIIAIVFMAIIAATLINFFMSFDSPLLQRFTIEAVESNGGAGRADNWEIIMTEIFPDYPIFGTGIGGTVAIKNVYHLDNLAHNIVIDPLSQLGLFGFLLFILFLAPYISNVIKMIRYKRSLLYVIVLAPLLAAVANGIGEIVFFEKFFWNDLGLCVLAYNVLGDNKRLPKL